VKHPAPGHRRIACAGGLARRKPRLLFRLLGLFLLRLAERRFLGLLFQEPPRRTRWLPFGPLPADQCRANGVPGQAEYQDSMAGVPFAPGLSPVGTPRNIGEGAPPPRPPQRVKGQRTKGYRVLARRKPRSSYRPPGLYLRRLAERRPLGLLTKEPPRRTRWLQSPDSQAVPSVGATS